MKSKSCCYRTAQQRATEARAAVLAAVVWVTCLSACAPGAGAFDAPAWMHALVNAPLPAHDEKTNAVELYAEEVLSVQANGKIKRVTREAYKILRPDGKGYGMIRANFDGETRITSIHGWCIPANGKDYEVKDKDAIETALFGVANGELVSDVRTKLLQIPAADPGNIVGYETEQEVRPYVLQDTWIFQDTVPMREARYTLQLPAGWEYKAVWLNHEEVKPVLTGSNVWQWVVNDVKAIKPENDMPPWRGVAGQMIISFIPQGGGQSKGFENWKEMGVWESALAKGRRDGSPEIKQKVAELTGSSTTPLAKMQALAKFLQHDIRYVAIELGIGGWQPHPAVETFGHRYGDCKDKATLMSTMLKEIGVDSYYVSINTERGAVTPDVPAHMYWFNHEILAIRLPDGVVDASLIAVMEHPKLGKLLIFDPTDELTPFGQLRGPLQANYGLLVTDDGGELVKLPQLPAAMNGTTRTAKLTVDPSGTLKGEVKEVRVGDRAMYQRGAMRNTAKDTDKIKTIETMLASSLSNFQITHATITNLQQTDLPFECDYSLVAEKYAKTAGNLLLVRPRVLGNRSSDLLETKEPRKYPVEFEGPSRDVDTFEITLPPGYEVDDLPPPVNAEYSFASYHSKAEATGNTLRYTRTFEVKELSVPLSKVEDLKRLYRIIAGDERNTAVLKPVGH
jgi:hypothetical protein